METTNSFVFRLYDLNGDNVLTLDELSRIFAAVYRLLGDNVNQKHNQTTYEAQAEKLYKKIDLKQTGAITREQFMEYCIRDESIVQTIKMLEMSICSSAWTTLKSNQNPVKQFKWYLFGTSLHLTVWTWTCDSH